jgi:glycosyltransferase involved in cell wall biosynthesis
MTFSLVITTYNRASVLKNLLIRLEEQSDRDFEVIVAMDGCTDGTLTMLEAHRPSYSLRWVDTGYVGYGLALARNEGILAAREGVVAIIDDDSLPVPSFVAAHRAAVAPRCITGGPRDPLDPACDPRLAGKMGALRELPAATPLTINHIRTAYPKAWLVENNVSMTRADWVDLGLFTERLRMYGVIGQEFFARAEHLGWSYQFAPEAGVIHRVELEGDNGLGRSLKMREVRRAGVLRPGLMTPQQYDSQRTWARARNEGGPIPRFSPWWPAACAHLGKRLVRRTASWLVRMKRA